jgi:hypothetical protein
LVSLHVELCKASGTGNEPGIAGIKLVRAEDSTRERLVSRRATPIVETGSNVYSPCVTSDAA